jgi:hypothetical protein
VLVFPRPALAAALRRAAPAALLRTLAGFLRALSRRRFDLVVDFQAVLRSALLGLASGAARRASHRPPFAREIASALATDRARLAPARASPTSATRLLFLGASAVPARATAGRRRRRARGRSGRPGADRAAPAPETTRTRGQSRRSTPRWRAHAELGSARSSRSGRAQGARSPGRAAPRRRRAARPATPDSPTSPLCAGCRLVVGPGSGPLRSRRSSAPVVQLLGRSIGRSRAWKTTPSRTLRAGPQARENAPAQPEAIVAAARALLTGPAPRSGARDRPPAAAAA